MEKKRIDFILHGEYIGKLYLKNKLRKAFECEAFECTFTETQRRHHALELSQKVVERGTDYLIAVGGDGTVSETINGLMLSPKEKRKNVILGVLPKGTGNDYARVLHVEDSPEQLARLIGQNQPYAVDVGEIEFTDFQGKRQSRFFDNVADIGLGAETVAQVNEASKFWGGNFTFIRATLKAFVKNKPKLIRIESPHFQWSGKVVTLCIAKGKYFGSGLGIAPQAQLDDGLLQLAIVGNVTKMDFVKNLPALKKAKIIKHPEIFYHRVTQCTIATQEKNCLLEMDGEVVGFPPLKVKIHPRAVRVLRTLF